MSNILKNKRILLIVTGGIAAYKSLELIRLIKKAGGHVRCILTKGGAQFVTPLSLAAISGEPVYDDLWSLKDEAEMGHIRLSREADLIVIAPASANMIAKMAYGFADDLASTTLLAADKPILIAPAMNHQMWANPATKENVAKLKSRGIMQIGPERGEMACNEIGMGRMAEPEEIFAAIEQALSSVGRGLGEGHKKSSSLKKNDEFHESFAPHPNPLPTGERGLTGLKAIVTSGPTFEPIDPVRFIGNRSSGKQGAAIASALAAAGMDVTLISGPVDKIDAPSSVKIIRIETARDMLAAAERALPADIFISAAAVADWAPEKISVSKIKKGKASPPALALKENPDILKTIAHHKKRPKLVIGFAAETQDLLKNAKEKLSKKGCDWILANDAKKALDADDNEITFITRKTTEKWPRQSKESAAGALAQKIAAHFQKRLRIAAE